MVLLKFTSPWDPEVLSQASQQSCQTLKQLFRQQMGQKSCPETLLIRSAQMRVSILPSRFGRRTVLMATDTLVSQLSDSELRFLLGREMGRAWLHHSELLSPWILQHFLRDVILFPLHVIGLQPKEPPMPKRSFKQWMLLRRWVDGIANACDVYRGLRSGTWPGLSLGKESKLFFFVQSHVSHVQLFSFVEQNQSKQVAHLLNASGQTWTLTTFGCHKPDLWPRALTPPPPFACVCAPQAGSRP